MKNRTFDLKSIEEDNQAIRMLHAFVRPLSKHPTLSEYLNGILADKHLKAPDVYHRAGLDRQIFNRIIQVGRTTRSSKRTLMQVAIGIYASEQEANELLATCGYTFELSSKEDQAFMFCILNGYYDMYNVYEAMELLDKDPLQAS